MTKEMEEMIDRYWNEDKHDKIVEMIMAVPEAERDIDMLGQLVVAYNNLSRYDDAIKLSMKLKAESIENASWYYRIAYAYMSKHNYEKAADYLEIGMGLAGKKENLKGARNCQKLYNQCLPHLHGSQKGKRIKNEPLEIVWSGEDNEYKVIKGAVDLGYLGSYRCYQIEVDFDDYAYNALLSDENTKDSGIFLRDYLEKNMNHDEIAEGLTDFFNERLQEMTKHFVQLNQAFLAHLMLDICDCEYEFWEECPSYVLRDRMPSCKMAETGRAIYTNDICAGVNKLFDQYYEVPMNGEVDNVPVAEEFIKKNFPMFDYKKMLKDVHSEYMVLKVSGTELQCTGEGEALNLVCSAYVNIRNNLSFYDWHNH